MMGELALIGSVFAACGATNDVNGAINDCVASTVLGASKLYLGPLAALGFVIWKIGHERTESARTLFIEGVAVFLAVEVLLALAGALMHIS